MKCEVCGGNIEEITTFEIENINERCYVKFEGCCHSCNSLYQWEELYEFIGSTAPEPVTEEV